MVVVLQEQLSESYPAIAASVPRARSVITAFAARAGISGEQMDAVRLAVSEAVTNAVRHAYRGTPGAFHVTASAAGDELWVLVADEGCGYQTPAADPGLGCGLAFIAQLSDQYVVTERSTGGTEVRMRFPIPAGARAWPGGRVDSTSGA